MLFQGKPHCTKELLQNPPLFKEVPMVQMVTDITNGSFSSDVPQEVRV